MELTQAVTASLCWDFASATSPCCPKPANLYDTILLPAQTVCETSLIEAVQERLSPVGLLFVYGPPEQLPDLAVALETHLTFKYWIALRARPRSPGRGHGHRGLLLFSRGRFAIDKVRVPHPRCEACDRTLRDWGGKSHLMHPEGTALSDVWSDLEVDPDQVLPPAVMARVAALAGLDSRRRGLILTGAAEGRRHRRPRQANAPARGGAAPVIKPRANHVYQGDCLEIMRGFADGCVDVAFADPPYNLAKNYEVFADDQTDAAYLQWCNAWLAEYLRLLKPGGSLFVLNLPRWAFHHYSFLRRRARFRRWVVWDALSEPRGKLMPAHYALLHFVKPGGPVKEAARPRAAAPPFCVRPACIAERRRGLVEDGEPLGDIWSDIFRLKHKRDRDAHPCQLPERLMERILALASRPGDVVLDAFSGAGTTAITAARMGRRYVAIDINPEYVTMTQAKLSALARGALLTRPAVPRPKPAVSKKELQLELQRIALKLGRLPEEREIERFSHYPLAVYRASFPSLGKALKAAKLVT